MENPEFNERRKHPRFPIKLQLKYCRENGPNQEDGYAHTNDISAKGMGMVTDEQLAPDTAIDIWIQIPHDELIHAKGKVIWSKLFELKYRAGVSLEYPELNPISLALRTIQGQLKDRHKF